MVGIIGMVRKSVFNKDRHGWNNRHGGKKVSLIRTDMVGTIDIPTTFYIWVMLALFAAPLSIGWYILPFWNHFLILAKQWRQKALIFFSHAQSHS